MPRGGHLPAGICVYLEQKQRSAHFNLRYLRRARLALLHPQRSCGPCCQRGDEVIISAYEFVDGPQDLYNRKPVVLTFNADNSVQERLRYVVDGEESGDFGFHVESE